MGKTLGQMTQAERDAVVGRAVTQLREELTANAAGIARVLAEPLPGETTVTKWRVWGLFPDDKWRPVSRPFVTERDAEIWALKLNMDHRTEEEDTD